jgi:predicted TPR repeat methyltransferase
MEHTKGNHEDAGERARSFFDGLWQQGDYWALESSAFEQEKYARAIALLAGRRYPRVLEIGCGAGAFTRLLADLSDHVLALDVSAAAIERAHGVIRANVEFRVANIMETEPESEGPWDLVVMSETIYYVGWLYSFFDVDWLARRLFATVTDGGRFLMANTFGDSVGYLLRPSLIRTYRDLFVNEGFRVEREEIFRGTKEGTPLEVLLSMFEKPVSG